MKKATIIFSLIIAIVCMAVPASASNNTETAVFTLTPQMTCQNCENKIKTNLRHEKGVKEIKTNLQTQTVTVTFNPAETDKDKIAAALKKIGYTATECKETNKCAGADKPACDKAAGCTKAADGTKTECCGKASENGCGGCKKASGACCKKSAGEGNGCGGCKK